MKSRPAALFTSALMLISALAVTGCDDTEPSQTPGVEEQEDSGNQDNNENDNDDDNNDDDSSEDDGQNDEEGAGEDNEGTEEDGE